MEDKIVEKAMNNLKKEEYNKRCADCNSVNPNYVNLTINSFICSRCCGILRDFNYKIKGFVSIHIYYCLFVFIFIIFIAISIH